MGVTLYFFGLSCDLANDTGSITATMPVIFSTRDYGYILMTYDKVSFTAKHVDANEWTASSESGSTFTAVLESDTEKNLMRKSGREA